MLEVLINRMIRAARLDVNLYEEVEADESATSQALLVVVICSLAGGIGAGLAALILGTAGFGGLVWGLIFGAIWAIIGWLIWSFLSYWIGTNFFQGTATYSEMLRAIGFAYSPQAISIFAFIPCLGLLLVLAALIWSLVAVVIAVRQALDFTTGRAIATSLAGWVIMIIVQAVLRLLVGAY